MSKLSEHIVFVKKAGVPGANVEDIAIELLGTDPIGDSEFATLKVALAKRGWVDPSEHPEAYE